MLADIDYLNIERLFAEFSRSYGYQCDIDDFRTWRQAIEEAPAGHLCLENLWRDHQLPEGVKIEILIESVVNYCKSRVDDIHADPFSILTAACQRFPDYGADINSGLGELCRFVDFEYARPHFPRRGRLGVNNSYDSALWKNELSEGGIIRDDRARSLQGRIKSRENINVFATISSWVDGLSFSSFAELPEKIRDGLGLPHLEGVDILEIRIPGDSVSRYGIIRKPTFADSGGYPPFMPSRKEDQYGFARDLSEEDIYSRGGPEVWHGDLPAREVVGLRCIGRPASPFKVRLWRDYNDWASRVR